MNVNISSDDECNYDLELESSSTDEEGWIETENNDNIDDSIVKCLFCPKEFSGINALDNDAIEHLKIDHQFDLTLLKSTFNMDQYSFLKMVNYIRINKSSPIEFTTATQCFWNDEKYLKPIEYESWLTFDFDYLQGTKADSIINEDITKRLEEEIKMKNSLLEQASNDIDRLKQTIKTLIETDDTDSPLQNKPKLIHNDDGYFNTYAHYEIHYDMLNDKIRTESYRDAILNNTQTIENKIVLDLGCGSGILSMFASKANASTVISIDQSDIIYQAMDIVRKNGIENITFVKGRIEDTEIPVDKVDVIISEWMGYFLLFEGMLDSVIYARDHHLKMGGLLLPDYCNLQLIGYGDECRYKEYITFWDNVYGFDMTTLKKEVIQEAIIEVCNPKFILTDSNIIAEFNLMTIDMNYSNFTFDFMLNVKQNGQLTSFVGYFDVDFNLSNRVHFSTSPESIPTHWKQAIFYLNEPIAVTVGQVLTGKISCRRCIKNTRSLVVSIELFGKTMIYNLN